MLQKSVKLFSVAEKDLVLGANDHEETPNVHCSKETINKTNPRMRTRQPILKIQIHWVWNIEINKLFWVNILTWRVGHE